jgi:hypothetical protein
MRARGTRYAAWVKGGCLTALVVTESSDGIEYLEPVPDRCDAKLLQRSSMAAEAHIAWRRHRIAGTEANQTKRPFARRRRLESQVLESLDGTRKDTGFLPISF